MVFLTAFGSGGIRESAGVDITGNAVTAKEG
jgi:hypothetical protein